MGGVSGKPLNWKAKLSKTLNIGEDTFVLAGVVATDKLIIYDVPYGLHWEETVHYTRAVDTIVFAPAMTEQLTFTIYVYD